MASLGTIYSQVLREGARWGLSPLLRAGKVAVCEMVSELPTRAAGHVVAPVRSPRVICSLDESSPMDAFAMILAHRMKRHQHDVMRAVLARQERLRAAERAEADLRRKDLRAALMSRVVKNRIMVVPGLWR